MSDLLKSCAVGTPVLLVGGKQYICTSMQYTMALNNIPSLSVVVGCGSGIGNPTTTPASAEDLLKQVLDKRKAAYTDLVECELREVVDIGNTKRQLSIPLFKGVIVTGCVVYHTGNTTTRAIRFQCMNRACKLFVSPIAGYYNICGAGLVTYYSNTDAEAQAQKSIELQGLRADQLNNKELVDMVRSQIKGATLDKAIALIVDQIIKSSSEDSTNNQTPADGSIARVADYLYSSYSLSQGLGKICEDDYLDSLCANILQQIKGTSIYNAIQQVIMSLEFMLELAPRHRNHNFMMEVTPSRAWESKPALTLTSDSIIGIDSSYNPIACLNTPDAFIVYLDAALELARQQGPADQLGMMGVYSTDDDMVAYIKSLVNGTTKPLSQATQDKMFKAKFFTAPKWIYSATVTQTAGDSDNKTEEQTAKRTKETNTAKTKQEQDINNLPNIDKRKVAALADEIAKAFFVHLYGAGDSAIIQLVPSARFGYDPKVGYLEEHIGDVIDIVLDTGEITNASSLNIRGVLETVQYNYSAGNAGSATYTIKLGRMRPLDKDEKAIQCPLYQRVKQ